MQLGPFLSFGTYGLVWFDGVALDAHGMQTEVAASLTGVEDKSCKNDMRIYRVFPNCLNPFKGL